MPSNELRHVGRRVLRYATISSTNDIAASLAADPANAGTVVIADEQTAGRGQHGRTWLSTPGHSLTLSVLLFPPLAIARPVVLTAWAAVGVADAVRGLAGVDARVKWPNDLLVGGRKLCGILTERGVGTVVGLGLNLSHAPAGLPATSLEAESGTRVDPPTAAVAVIRSLDWWYGELLDGHADRLEAAWAAGFGLLGRTVVAELADDSFVRGRLSNLAFDGVTIAGRTLIPERVRHLTADE